MSQKFIRKIQKINKYSYVITVPKEIIDKFKWRERQKLEIVFDGKKPELKIRDWKPKNTKTPARLAIRNVAGRQKKQKRKK